VRTLAACLLATLLAAGCGACPDGGGERLDATRIESWLHCEECNEGELEAVVAFGDEAVPSLAAALRGGLSPARRERMAQRLGAFYDAQHGTGTGGRGREAFIAHHVGKREALVRVRAAHALGFIGTGAAEAALREALALEQRPSVEQSLKKALARATR
jgi:hypothetical protein